MERMVDVGGAVLRCRIEGAASGPWLVFGNSLLTDLELWDAQVRHFAGRFRVLRYDQRGHGGSTVPARPCAFDELADDVVRLMDAIGIARASFVGISMGAVTGLSLAVRYRQRLVKLVAADAPARAPSGARQAWEQRIGLARESGMPALAEATVTRWCAPETASDIRAAITAMILRTPVEGFCAGAQALMAYDCEASLPRISVPTLYVVGAADGVLPQVMRAMHASTPGSGFVQVAGAGHLTNFEQPAAFNAALTAFLTDGTDR